MEKTIKITIKENSKTAVAFRAYMAEKEEFRKAVISGNAVEYIKQRNAKFAASL